MAGYGLTLLKPGFLVFWDGGGVDPVASPLTPRIENLRFEYEYEFLITVCRLYVIRSHTNVIPEATFFTGKQHEGVRSLETPLV